MRWHLYPAGNVLWYLQRRGRKYGMIWKTIHYIYFCEIYIKFDRYINCLHFIVVLSNLPYQDEKNRPEKIIYRWSGEEHMVMMIDDLNFILAFPHLLRFRLDLSSPSISRPISYPAILRVRSTLLHFLLWQKIPVSFYSSYFIIDWHHYVGGTRRSYSKYIVLS